MAGAAGDGEHRPGRSRACAANQSSKAETSLEFLVLGFEFKNLPNREIHEIREKEMKKILGNPPKTKESKTNKLWPP